MPETPAPEEHHLVVSLQPAHSFPSSTQQSLSSCCLFPTHWPSEPAPTQCQLSAIPHGHRLMTLSSDIYVAKSRCYFLSTQPGHRSHPMCLVIFSQKCATFQTPILLLSPVASSCVPLCWSPCGKQELSSVPPLSSNTPRAETGCSACSILGLPCVTHLWLFLCKKQ